MCVAYVHKATCCVCRVVESGLILPYFVYSLDMEIFFSVFVFISFC